MFESAAAKVQRRGTLLGKKYIIDPELKINSSGGQGEILVVLDGAYNRLVAKFPRPSAPGKTSKEEQLLHELRLWATLADHENVARLVDFGREFGVPVLLLQHAQLGNLAEYIEHRQQECTLDDEVEAGQDGNAEWLQEPLDWCIQVCNGLQFLHDSCVIHGDIKPQNLLVYPDGDTPVLQITDLGLSTPGRWESPVPQRTPNRQGAEDADHLVSMSNVRVFGTAKYRAPEQRRNNEKISQKVDCWSLGVVILYAIRGALPPSWPDADSEKCLACMLHHCRLQGAPILIDGLAPDCDLHENVYELIESCLSEDPRTRPGTQLILDTLILAYASEAVSGKEYPFPRKERHFCLPDNELIRRQMLIERQVLGDKKKARQLEAQFNSLKAEAPHAAPQPGMADIVESLGAIGSVDSPPSTSPMSYRGRHKRPHGTAERTRSSTMSKMRRR